MNSGTESQALVRMTAAMAPFSSASQVMGSEITPDCSNTALSTPYWPLKIHAARKAVTVVGSTQGSSEAARTKPRPANDWFIISAQPRPRMKVRPVVSTTNTRVLSQTVAIPGSASSLWKFARPTKAGLSISMVYLYSESRSDCRKGTKMTAAKATRAGSSSRKPVRRSWALSPGRLAAGEGFVIGAASQARTMRGSTLGQLGHLGFQPLAHAVNGRLRRLLAQQSALHLFANNVDRFG